MSQQRVSRPPRRRALDLTPTIASSSSTSPTAYGTRFRMASTSLTRGDAPSAFASLLALPVTVARSPRIHLVLLRSLLILLLLGAAAGLSSTSYFVLYFTWARVPSFSEPLELTYGSPNHPPHGSVILPVTGLWRPGQAYDVSVELDCPLTAANIALGNFMVGLDVLPVPSPTPLYSATRSGLLTPPPVLSPANLLPLVWGTSQRTVRLTLLNNVILDDGRKQRAGRVTVWVGREDGWRGASGNVLSKGTFEGAGRELHTTGARIVIQGRLSGLRSLLNNHPFLSLSALTSLSLLTTLLAALLSFYLFSPSFRPKSTSVGASKTTQPAGAARLRSTTREKEWAATLPRAMDIITGDVSGSASSEEETASPLSAADEEEEEATVVRLRAKEAEVRRVRHELEEAEERAADAAAERARADRATATVAAQQSKDESRDVDREGSLLGGSGTTLSHRSFGATTVTSTSTSTGGSGGGS